MSDQRSNKSTKQTRAINGHPNQHAIGPVSESRYMARLRAIGADLGTGHLNNIQWMTVVTSD